jgi:hypothetical protein
VWFGCWATVTYADSSRDGWYVNKQENVLELFMRMCRCCMLPPQRALVYTLPKDGSAPAGPLDRESATEVKFDEPAYSLGGGACQSRVCASCRSPGVRWKQHFITSAASCAAEHQAHSQHRCAVHCDSM